PGMPAERLEAVGELFHRLLQHLRLAGPDPVQHGTRIALVLTGPSAPAQGLAEDPGVACARFSVMWYHRWETGSCEPFWYGGCGGNANRFSSEQDCACACTHPGR
uniref:BPTI/Kunitz inhibitor domain-containing protein n=1 Tax=Athene cunicularia TaxID=194338 RepID=A0A663N803_ATHCN